ncbi:UNVERIFIED_CONTAM: hypothetical protein K2H54_043059 [Gekko kuhli]
MKREKTAGVWRRKPDEDRHWISGVFHVDADHLMAVRTDAVKHYQEEVKLEHVQQELKTKIVVLCRDTRAAHDGLPNAICDVLQQELCGLGLHVGGGATPVQPDGGAQPMVPPP